MNEVQYIVFRRNLATRVLILKYTDSFTFVDFGAESIESIVTP